MSGAPVGPSLTLDEKKGRPGTTVDCTNAYSSTFGSPLSPRRHISANRAPAYAMDSVADPCAVPCQVLVPRKKKPQKPCHRVSSCTVSLLHSMGLCKQGARICHGRRCRPLRSAVL